MQNQKSKPSNFLDWLTLLSSAGTLVCCALPALMVTLGAGAALAGLVSSVPGLIWISRHKIAVFTLAGILLTVSGLLRLRSRKQSCPIEPHLAVACSRSKNLSNKIYPLSCLLYLTGLFFAFLAPKLF